MEESLIQFLRVHATLPGTAGTGRRGWAGGGLPRLHVMVSFSDEETEAQSLHSHLARAQRGIDVPAEKGSL